MSESVADSPDPRGVTNPVEALTNAHLALLHSSPAVFFERVARIAANLSGMKTAAVCLVENGRVLVKALHGEDHLPSGFHDLCLEVANRRERIQRIERNEDSAEGAESGRLMVGVPLISRARVVLGVLVVSASAPTVVDEDLEQVLDVMASYVTSDMEFLIAQFRRERAMRRFQTVRRMAATGGWEYWLNERTLVLSPEAHEVLGTRPQDRLTTAKAGLALIPREARARVLAAVRRTLGGGGPLSEEFEKREARRNLRYFLLRAELLEADAFLPRRLAGVVREVTDRRRAEAALRASHIDQMRLLANLPGIAYRCEKDPPWPMMLISDGARALCGYAAKDLLQGGGVRYADLVHPEDLEKVTEAIDAALQEDAPYRLTYRLITRDGEEKWVWEQGMGVRDDEGELLYLEGFIGDITDQRHTAELLRESEERFRLLSEATNDTLWDLDVESRRLWWSEGIHRVFGLEPEAHPTVENSWAPRVHTGDLDRVVGEIRNAMESGSEAFEVSYRFRRANGEFAHVIDRGRILRNDDGTAYRMVGGMTDVTERRELEAQFFRAQRMESIGGLASGIAHDLNNLLSPIVMGMQLLQRTEQNPRTLRIIGEIERSALRGTELVKQVLSFARGIEGQRVPIQLKHLFAELEGILHSTLPPRLRVRTQVPRDLRPVRADATQISQVLLNLCVNARDAMPDGGQIQIRASNHLVDPDEAKHRTEGKSGSFVIIEVQDEGTGMSPEVKRRIFEPFFTTKEIGKGTGLGLSTTIGIVRSHQGFVEVESEVGEGTTFRILLPSIEGAVGNERAEDMKSAPRGNGEWILVVDDEASIRSITRDTLETFGYRVLCASDGADGIGRFAERRDEIALVVTDMMMPVLGGEGFIAAVRRLDPAMPIVGMSGSLSKDPTERAFRSQVTSFLPKPVSARRLLDVVRECLDAKA